MLNRRYVRIKAFQTLYSYAQAENQELKTFLTFYRGSVDKLWLSYLHSISLFGKIYQQLEKSLDNENQKHIILKEEQAKFNKLLANPILQRIYESESLDQSISKSAAGWDNDMDKIQHLYVEYLNHESTLTLLSKEEPTDDDFHKHIIAVFRYFLNDSELLNGLYEDAYMNWLDDKPVVLANLQKFVKLVHEKGFVEVKKDKDWDDILSFGEELIRKNLSNDEELNTIVSGHCKNWESDRIAMTDSILLKMGTSEFLFFDSIPVKVTMNEYIELAKLYSTPKSGKFVNGVLDSILKDLKEQGKLVKRGMGLVG